MSQFVEMMPFAATLGITITSADAAEVVGTIEHSAHRTTAGGVLHGGALMTLADSIGAVCAYLNLPEGATTATTSSHTLFLRGVRHGTVTATARPVHVGRTAMAISTDLHDGEGNLVGRTTQTQAVLRP